MSFFPTLYALIPMACGIMGALLASFITLKPLYTSILQHFVAGIIVAAASLELLPKIHSTYSSALGFLLGVVFMAILHELGHVFAKKEKLPLAVLAGSALDLFLDGLLIGIAFAAGIKSSFYIAISLASCAFVLTFTLSSFLRKYLSKTAEIFSIAGICLALPLGAFMGSNIVELLPPFFMDEILAFGVAALLYLGIEEFIVEAHTYKHNHLVCLTFFLGFLIVFVFR